MPRHELEQALEAANADPLVSGIMVYYPVFGNEPSFYGGSMDDYLRDTIAVEKDVETAHAQDEAAQAKEAELPRDAADAAAETDPGAAV